MATADITYSYAATQAPSNEPVTSPELSSRLEWMIWPRVEPGEPVEAAVQPLADLVCELKLKEDHDTHGEHSEWAHLGVMIIAVLLCVQASRHARHDWRRLDMIIHGKDDIDTDAGEKKAMAAQGDLFSHPATWTLMVTKLPKAFPRGFAFRPGSRPNVAEYGDRGWPCVELAISRLVKGNKNTGLQYTLTAVTTTLLSILVFMGVSAVSKKVVKPAAPMFAIAR